MRFWQQYGFRRRRDSVIYLLGIALALLGAWLGITRAPVSVKLDGGGYHVAGQILRTVSVGEYQGDAALVIRKGGGTVRAASTGNYGGEPMRGICILVAGTGQEQCIFVIGKQSFTAEDHLDGGVWHRRYSDGLVIDIHIDHPSDPTPVPFPVGRG